MKMKKSKQNLKSAGRMTLKSISEGLQPFPKYIGYYTKKYRNYQARLAKFVFWWNDHWYVWPDETTRVLFETPVLKYKREKCLVTRLAIHHSLMSVSVTLKPMDYTADIGNGCGCSKTITF